ncbi:MAG: hypothetical protein U0804_19760 [Gemmataceae bacterium]
MTTIRLAVLTLTCAAALTAAPAAARDPEPRPGATATELKEHLDRCEARLAVSRAGLKEVEAVQTLATTIHARQFDLWQKGAAPRDVVDRAKAELDVAVARVERVRAEVRLGEVEAAAARRRHSEAVVSRP